MASNPPARCCTLGHLHEYVICPSAHSKAVIVIVLASQRNIF